MNSYEEFICPMTNLENLKIDILKKFGLSYRDIFNDYHAMVFFLKN
ncbi:hypothetical protein SAMN05216249_12011 [Acetitomaculum ruminis DSM 5522]|uniref:Uncharacterized protein n=1 Tax=Acetitomaculum ruminis DSM 5522 TaxID=1120918 RepID=A0A1I1A5I6_9FIRM|nr:hypothetical protein [Acetitomaculum ruminis]SFB31838.1 hypothetical protein SAMN05216249_12011 [Acetitomaculum ruminis DSM 5522]